MLQYCFSVLINSWQQCKFNNLRNIWALIIKPYFSKPEYRRDCTDIYVSLKQSIFIQLEHALKIGMLRVEASEALS